MTVGHLDKDVQQDDPSGYLEEVQDSSQDSSSHLHNLEELKLKE